jgi:hypothetical protein
MRRNQLALSSFPSSLPSLADRGFDTLTVTELSHQRLCFGDRIWLATLCQRGDLTLRCARSMASDYSARR